MKNPYINLITGVIDKYAKTYPDLTDKELQAVMASEIVDVLVAHENAKASKRAHNRADVAMEIKEVHF